MTDTLVTAVSNTLTRVVAMQPLAVPSVSTALKRWVDFQQNPPYWANRPGGWAQPTGAEGLPIYQQTIQMRLALGYYLEAARTDDIDGNIQEKAWEYQAATLRYFEKYRMLKPPTYAELTHIAPEGCSISCPTGLNLVQLPGSQSIYLVIDFDLTVPYLIGTEEA